MNISKREKFLVGILLALIITFVYYQFIYTKQVKKLDEKRNEKAEVEEKYNAVMRDIKSIDAKESEVKTLKTSINEKTKRLYPIIMQEKIIIELDKLLNDNGLAGNIAFTPKEVAAVEKLKSEEISNVESSLKKYVDEYEGNEVSSKENSTELVQGEEATQATEEKNSSDSEETTSEQLKVAINFNGSYTNLKSFIAALESYSRKIAITNISITAKSQEELTGVMNLEFHAVPKLSGGDEEYLKWTLNNVYGKDILFSSGAASGAYASTIEEQSNEEDIKDFVMMLKPSSSELPTLTIGKAKDDLRESYITADNEKVENLEIVFDELDGKTYFKYKTTNSYYPKEDTSKGKEFTPKSSDIIVEILSEKRSETSDNSGVKLSVINNTSKKIEVIVKNDDTTNPRVFVTSKGNIVNITKK